MRPYINLKYHRNTALVLQLRSITRVTINAIELLLITACVFSFVELRWAQVDNMAATRIKYLLRCAC